ncbi:Cytochrome oxidase assembly [Cystobasidiomycetes sp. EMM_F5]
MAVFPSQRLQPRKTTDYVRSASRRHPFLYFGLPFVAVVVAGSFGLSSLTQTRYDLRASRVQTMSKEDELRMDKNRKKVDIREEYFRLQAKSGEDKTGSGGLRGTLDSKDEWENKRIQRLPGQAEWGELPKPT